MNKRLGLKVLAIGCVLLLIASVFLPLVNYSGYTTSIFDTNKEINYFPYILIVFSLISIIVIVLNKKTEFAYLLVGSSLTFIITTTIGSIDNFKYFSFGYYLFLLSSILLFISLSILNRDENNKKSDKIVNNSSIEFSESENNNLVEPVEPNELAKSIMDQPVMNEPTENNIKSSIDFDDFNEEVTLAPQNPLNSFLPSDFDPSKIVKEENNVKNEIDTEEINKSVNEEKSINKNNDQSIMNIMSQPMVNTNLNNTPIVEPRPIEQPNISINPNLSANIPNMQPAQNNTINQNNNQVYSNGQQFNNTSGFNNINSNIPYQNINNN